MAGKKSFQGVKQQPLIQSLTLHLYITAI